MLLPALWGKVGIGDDRGAGLASTWPSLSMGEEIVCARKWVALKAGAYSISLTGHSPDEGRGWEQNPAA
jgi:hypothetical protein